MIPTRRQDLEHGIIALERSFDFVVFRTATKYPIACKHPPVPEGRFRRYLDLKEPSTEFIDHPGTMLPGARVFQSGRLFSSGLYPLVMRTGGA